MQYAHRLPNTKTLLTPVVALAIAASAATGAYALLDDDAVSVQSTGASVTEPANAGTAGADLSKTSAEIRTQTSGLGQAAAAPDLSKSSAEIRTQTSGLAR
jgi:hypothetical protein